MELEYKAASNAEYEEDLSDTQDLLSLICYSSLSSSAINEIQETTAGKIFEYDLNLNGTIEDSEKLPAYYITILTPDNHNVWVFDLQADYDADTLDDLDNSMDSAYPSTPKIDNATALYNCHSYAWFSQDYKSNTYWMNFPHGYYNGTNRIYVEVSTPAIGDIICYFDNAGDNMHSGIVISVTSGTSNGVCGNSNLVTVQSKWGAGGGR